MRHLHPNCCGQPWKWHMFWKRTCVHCSCQQLRFLFSPFCPTPPTMINSSSLIKDSTVVLFMHFSDSCSAYSKWNQCWCKFSSRCPASCYRHRRKESRSGSTLHVHMPLRRTDRQTVAKSTVPLPHSVRQGTINILSSHPMSSIKAFKLQYYIPDCLLPCIIL